MVCPMMLLSLLACLPSWPEYSGSPRDADTDAESDADADADADTDTDADGDTDTDTSSSDEDGDGYTVAEGDCDDGNAAINPLATDVVGDNVDQNCDGIDGTDADGDGYAADWSGGEDCDDEDEATYPGEARSRGGRRRSSTR